MKHALRRDLHVDRNCDVLIAGGGPAGCSAALAAARLGADVVLLEATGALGGMGTSGLVCAFDPMADGERNLVGGIMREIVETLYERGQLPPQVTPDFWRVDYHRWTPFRVEALKALLDELVVEAGIEVRLFTNVIDAEVDDRRVRGVVTHNIEGMRFTPARTFIDCTGDAVLTALCGAEYRTNPEFMPGTLCSLHSGIDWSRMRRGEEALVRDAIADGHFTQPDRHLPGLSRVGNDLGYLNGGHLFGKDPLTCKGRTEGMMLGRKLVQEYADFYRKYVPGCENLELVITAALMGIRESRRIVGEYELTFDDYVARRQFPDQIGIFNKFVDRHPRDCSDEEWQRLQEEIHHSGRLGRGECFGLPYGILVPRGWRNLWVAGRCNSSDIKVHGSIRVMPAAAMMGQAAGTAAYQSIRTGREAAEIDTRQLVETLREQHAVLPQEELSDSMTRSAAHV